MTPAEERAEELIQVDKGLSGLDGPVSQRLNRPLSREISQRVSGLPFTPEHWSHLAFGCVCVGAGAFALNAPRTGALLVHAGSVIDGVDGEVARLQNTSSPQGGLLDLALDRGADVALLAGLAHGAGGSTSDWLLALAGANGILTASVVKERIGAEGLSVARLQRDESSGDVTRFVLRFTNRDSRLFVVTLAGLIKQPRLALAWLAATTSFRLVQRLHTARSSLRQLGRDRDGGKSA